MVNIDAATERCGACGAAVGVGADVCLTCGALLDAYRLPPPVDPFAPAPTSTSAPASARSAAPTVPIDRVTVFDHLVESDVIEPELIEARRRLLQTLAAPRRELVEAVESIERGWQAPVIAPPRRQPQPIARPAEPSEPSQRRAPVAAAPATWERVPPPSAPRRPGYVVRGTVEPTILLGVLMVMSACFIAAVGSMLGGGAWLGIAFLAAAIGVIMVLGAVLVALVRRDSERG